MPATEEQLRLPETKEGTAFAIEWILSHRKEFKKDSVLRYTLQNLERTKKLLDNDLNLNPNREKEILAKSLDDFFDLHEVDSFVRAEILKFLAVNIETIRGEKDPKRDWWDSFRRQSKEKKENIPATLIGNSGSWKAGFEVPNPTEDSGVKELKTCLNQFMVDLASVIVRTGAKEFEYVAELDPRKQKNLIDSASKYLNEAKQKPKPCNLQSFNPLIYVKDGTYFYREVGELGTTPVRLFREKDGLCQYLDIPLNTFQAWDTQKIDADIKKISEQDDFQWEDAKKIDPLSQGPIISPSIATSPSPDSLLYKLARSGSSIVHLNYNPDRKSIECYFNHLSFDGLPGMELALNMAETVGAKKKNKPTGLRIDFQPPTKLVEITPDIAKKTIDAINNDLSNKNFIDHPDVLKFVDSLGVSDVSLSNDLDPNIYQDINLLCETINNTWYKEITDKIDEVIESDKKKHKTIPGEKTLKEIKNRLLAVKMTPSKFLDLMTQKYFGCTVVCNSPRDPEVRLTVSQVPTIKDTSPSFLEKRTGKGTKKRLKEELDRLRNAYYLMIEEYARTYLQDFSPLIGIQSETDWFRTTTEVTAAVLIRKSQESASVVAMTSSIPEIARGDTAITEFTSAQTTSKEPDFAYSIANLVIEINGQKTLRCTHRLRHKPETLDSLDILNLINEDFGILSPQEQQETAKFLKRFTETAGVVYELKNANLDHKISNILVLASILSKNTADLKIVQNLILAASIKDQKVFYNQAGIKARQYTTSLSV